MIEKFVRWRSSLDKLLSTPAGPYLDGLAADLHSQGFGRWKLRRRLQGAAHFSVWCGLRGLQVAELNEKLLPEFRGHLRACSCPGRFTHSFHGDAAATAGAEALIRVLRRMGIVISPAPLKSAPELPELIWRFCDWIRKNRGIQDGSIRAYAGVLCKAVATLGDHPQQYDARSVRTFVLKETKATTRSQCLLIVTAVRMFMRFLIAEGMCRTGLEGAVPKVAVWRLASLPRYLPAEQVNRIIEAADQDTPTGLRDRAALLFLARLGLRAGDVRALSIGDIDWERGCIRVAGKSRTEVRLPLTQEVGDALLRYLDHGRPPAATDRVFVRMPAPWQPLKISSISALVSRAITRSGVNARFRGAHTLRHSAATEMLRQGATLDQVGAVLRHRCLDTTAHYAKVDVNRLREIALPWPGVTPC